ncbi:hypothetical protein MNBD_GAMMA07-2395 [hydrothermal vent metagenome]|uniref:Uncharacterized protein n=1 Tax=hydrothermal vent metagenome TaxID=652676 RepID=A0A3B0WWX1_9ZZZZ
MKIKSLFSITALVAASLTSSVTVAADCGWVGVQVKDCVVFEGLGDFKKVFYGPGKYAVRYLNTASWLDFNLMRATSLAIGASSITVKDVNGVDMTGLYNISHGTYSTVTGVPVGTVSSDATFIYDVKGNKSGDKVKVTNICSWSGWC